MDALRRTLVLSMPALAVTALHGCGGAEDDQQTKASAQAVGTTTPQVETATNTGVGFAIKNRNGANFPLIEGAFNIPPSARLIQAVLNTGSPSGLGPVLATQVSARTTSGADTLVGEVSVSVKLGTIPTGSAVYDLASGGAQASDGLVTCRQISPDGSVKCYAYRIVSGSLVVSGLNQAGGSVVITLRDIVATPAVGFANAAQGNIAVSTNTAPTLIMAVENTGTQLT